jgi:hypothetical protein
MASLGATGAGVDHTNKNAFAKTVADCNTSVRNAAT